MFRVRSWLPTTASPVDRGPTGAPRPRPHSRLRRGDTKLPPLLTAALIAALCAPTAQLLEETPESLLGSELCSSGGRGDWGSWHGECLSGWEDPDAATCIWKVGPARGRVPPRVCPSRGTKREDQTSCSYPSASDAKVAVREAFRHAWSGYKKWAWGRDELAPVSRRGVTTFGDLGVTIVDALDTAIVMGLADAYAEARAWVASSLRFERASEGVSFFETIIRVLGGLLSAHYLTGDALFLERAVDLGDRLVGAYAASPSGLPMATLNLTSLEAWNPEWGPNLTTLSEATTVQLEMAALSRLSGNDSYARLAERTIDVVLGTPSLIGQRPYFLDTYTLKPSGRYGYGARGDSYYEYLIKRSIQAEALGEPEEVVAKYRDNWVLSVQGLVSLLLMESAPSGLKFLAEMHSDNNSRIHKMDHLACFTPGMLALGARKLGGDAGKGYLKLAGDLVHTCVQFYGRQCTGLSPELVYFLKGPAAGAVEDFTTDSWHHILRPETVESLYLLYEITGDERYRRWGWDLFCAWEQHSKIPTGGYSGLNDVRRPGSYNDVQESYFLAETLKYLYLLFDDSGLVSLDEWLFNTEAHLLSIDPGWNEQRGREIFEAFMAGDRGRLQSCRETGNGLAETSL
eukprot:evm.model.scf_3184EXC.2 EVM.evm.TU.scf_3184EXC.2   scf_3184EXC:6154-8690(-)